MTAAKWNEMKWNEPYRAEPKKVNENISIVEIQEQWNDIVTMYTVEMGDMQMKRIHKCAITYMHARQPNWILGTYQMGRAFEIYFLNLKLIFVRM